MKILMVLDHEFPPDIRVENEIASLHNAGHEIHIACFTRQNGEALEKTSTCVIHRKRISAFFYKSSVACLTLPFYFAYWRKFVTDILVRYSFDAIHVHDLPLARIGFEVNRRHGIKFILDLHENWPAFVAAADHTNTLAGKIVSPVGLWISYERQMVSRADWVITVVEEMRDRLTANGGNPDKIIVVPNTIRIGEYPESERIPDTDTVILLYSGGIDNQRGLHIPIEAMPQIIREQPNVRLWLVGKGSFENKLKERVEQLKISGHVVFWGWQDPAAMYALIQQAHIAIIPYLRTMQTDCSSPNKLFQYMYAGKPVLASNCTSVKRIIEETKSGRWYEHNIPFDFSAKAIELAKNTPERIQLGKNGKSSVLKKYNWDKTAESLIKIYS
jgi:glycosyltransferase involved in cell wall biosynthesis